MLHFTFFQVCKQVLTQFYKHSISKVGWKDFLAKENAMFEVPDIFAIALVLTCLLPVVHFCFIYFIQNGGPVAHKALQGFFVVWKTDKMF